jgi:GDP-4-dehydro-6-deoxy-D-mannose reductase
VYGLVSPEELPISEDRIPAPRNPYAVSKLSAEWLCRQFELTEGLNICIARPFNHTGAGQTTAFALPHFASQVAEIYWRKKPPVIEVGDIDVTRDFCTVGDVLQAYLAILEDGKRGEIYNVCSERELRLRDALDWMMRAAGVRAEVRQDVARLRMAEQRRVQGSAAKLRRHTGWTPRDSADKLLHDLLLDWMLRKSR